MSKEEFVSYPSLTFDPPRQQPPALAPQTLVPPVYQNLTVSSSSTQPQFIGSNSCGKCQKPINSSAQHGAVVIMSCRHTMHGSCFAKTVRDQNLELTCDENFGGAQHCVNCFAAPLVNMFDFKSVADTDSALIYFRSNFVKKYKDSQYSLALKETELTLEQKRAILGVSSSIFSRDQIDYSLFRPDASSIDAEEIVRILVSRGRTLEKIFSYTGETFNAQHLYRFGVNSLARFRQLGYDAARHGGPAYRDKCPYWMLVDLYNFDYSVLFEFQTADSLLASQIHPKELLLCGITMDVLIAKKLSKRALIDYRFGADMLIDNLGMTHAHLISLNITKGDVFGVWQDSKDNRVKYLLSNIPQ